MCYKLCNTYYKLCNKRYKLCNKNYLIGQENVSYMGGRFFKQKRKNICGKIRAVCACKHAAIRQKNRRHAPERDVPPCRRNKSEIVRALL